MKFVRARVLPTPTQGDTFYLIADGEELLEIHVTSPDNSEIRRIPLNSDLFIETIAFSETPPSMAVKQSFWWETGTGTLFVKYANDGNPTWMEAIPTLTVPEFAGNGEAITMSRSDHWHEGVMVTGDFV